MNAILEVDGDHLAGDVLRTLLHYEPETGTFRWLVKPAPRYRAGQTVGTPDKDRYLRVQIRGRTYKLHRLAFLYMRDAWPQGQVDHIDGNKTNNRWGNLRDVDQATNQQNRRSPQRGAAIGLLGVYRKKGNRKFTARISIGGRRVGLGSYETPQAAHDAYLRAKRAYHPGGTL